MFLLVWSSYPYRIKEFNEAAAGIQDADEYSWDNLVKYADKHLVSLVNKQKNAWTPYYLQVAGRTNGHLGISIVNLICGFGYSLGARGAPLEVDFPSPFVCYVCPPAGGEVACPSILLLSDLGHGRIPYKGGPKGAVRRVLFKVQNAQYVLFDESMSDEVLGKHFKGSGGLLCSCHLIRIYNI